MFHIVNEICKHILILIHATFQAFTEVNIQVEVFWVVTPCSIVVGYYHFRSSPFLHPENGGSMDL